jgi:hypothetical protein
MGVRRILAGAVGPGAALALTLLIVLPSPGAAVTSAGTVKPSLPPIKHVFVVVLENESRSSDTGAVMLSPCIRPGTVSHVAYNHHTMLRSVEDLFRLPHLGYAGLSGARSFGSDIFTRRCGSG